MRARKAAHRKPPGGSVLPTALLALVVAGCYSGEGSGNVVFEPFPVEPFGDIVLNGEGVAIVTEGDHGVFVSVEDDVLPSVQVEVRGETLVLGREVDWIDGVRPTVPIEYRVTLPDLRSVEVSGSGRAAIRHMRASQGLSLAVTGSGAIDAVDVEGGDVAVEVSGAGSVRVSGLFAEGFVCDISGSGRVTAAGTAETIKLDIGGSGLYRGVELRGLRAQAEVGGVGQAFVWAEEQLEVEVSGLGKVTYRGDPAIDDRVVGNDRVVALAVGRGRPGG